jgi:Fic family protein
MPYEKSTSLKNEIDNHRPLPPDLMKTLTQKFREEWTYHTNAIEGNTLTLQETAFFLREGLTVKGKTLREYLEIVNHAEAVYFLSDAIKQRDLTEGLIKEFHALLFEGVKAWTGGKRIKPGLYKSEDNHVLTPSGDIHYYTPAVQVPNEMEALLSWFMANKDTLHPIELAATFHHRFVAIHPFPDGNGRVSRLCMNFILMKNGYPPAVIRQENRFEYYLALEQADNGDIESFLEVVNSEVDRSLQTMIDVLRRQL